MSKTKLTQVRMIYLLGKPKGVIVNSYTGSKRPYDQYTSYVEIRLENGLLLRDVRYNEYEIIKK